MMGSDFIILAMSDCRKRSISTHSERFYPPTVSVTVAIAIYKGSIPVARRMLTSLEPSSRKHFTDDIFKSLKTVRTYKTDFGAGHAASHPSPKHFLSVC